MLKKVAILILVSAWASAPAFHEGKPPGAKFVPEVTNKELQQQQQFQKTMGEVGSIERKKAETPGLERPTTDAEAAKILADAPQPDSNSGSTMREADDRIKNDGKFQLGSTLTWGGIVGLLGFAAVFGLRQWANKNIPAPVSVKKTNW